MSDWSGNTSHESHRPVEIGRPLVRIHLLGPMRATTCLGEDILPRQRKARAILGRLCLASGTAIARAQLAALLWDGVPDDQAAKGLRRSLRELTAAMGRLARELLSIDRETVRLNAHLCWIDAAALLATRPNAPDLPRSDLAALCTGGLLEDVEGVSAAFDRWLIAERTRFTEKLANLLEAERAQTPGSRHDATERILAIRESGRGREALGKTPDAQLSPKPQRVDEYPPEPPFSRRLRVGVLPLLVPYSRHEEDLAFSLSQSLAAALARYRWFDVLGPTLLPHGPSAPRVAGAALKRHQLDYVVDGAITQDGGLFQVRIRLFQVAEAARPVWSDWFRLPTGALHRLDERVTARIVAQIDPVILFIEAEPPRRKHYGATGLLLLAKPLMARMERDRYGEAANLIDRALEVEPGNAMVSTCAALWQFYYAARGWSRQFFRAYAAAQEHARRAIRIDPDNAEAQGIYAHMCALLDKDFDSALHHFDLSLRLNPSGPLSWGLSALTYCYVGEPAIALARLERYHQIGLLDPSWVWLAHFHSVAHTFKGDYERAVLAGRDAVKTNPGFALGHWPLIASLGHLGRRDQAQPYVRRLLSLEPDASVERFEQFYPFKHASDRERYAAGLRLAGVPKR